MPNGYSDRTPSQRVWLTGAAALVALLLIGGGLLVWRGLTHPAASVRHSVQSIDSLDRSVAVGWGAPELENGVPWGFPLTPDGATAAAVTAVATTGQADVVFDPRRFAEVAGVVFSESQAAVQARQVEAARTEFELSGWASQPESRRMYFFAPLAAKLVAYDEPTPSATVDVWAMTVVGVGDAGGAVFTTSTVDLASTGRTWTVTGLDTVDGPTPLVQATASAPGRTRALLRDALATSPLPVPSMSRP